jgi:hypothetical protein
MIEAVAVPARDPEESAETIDAPIDLDHSRDPAPDAEGDSGLTELGRLAASLDALVLSFHESVEEIKCAANKPREERACCADLRVFCQHESSS